MGPTQKDAVIEYVKSKALDPKELPLYFNRVAAYDRNKSGQDGNEAPASIAAAAASGDATPASGAAAVSSAATAASSGAAATSSAAAAASSGAAA